MSFSPHRFASGTVAALLALALCAHASAADTGQASTVTAAAAAAAAPALAPQLAPAPKLEPKNVVVPGLGAAAPTAVLDKTRGGADGMAASADLRGAVTGNSATNVVTGNNTIQASSFAGASGIPIVIQNTGANVLIQNATVINLQFQ